MHFGVRKLSDKARAEAASRDLYGVLEEDPKEEIEGELEEELDQALHKAHDELDDESNDEADDEATLARFNQLGIQSSSQNTTKTQKPQDTSDPDSDLPGIPSIKPSSSRGTYNCNAAPTLTGIPQELRDLIFSHAIVNQPNFETCSNELCTPQFLNDGLTSYNTTPLTIRAVSRDLYHQTMEYLYYTSKVYIDVKHFLIPPSRAHIHRPTNDVKMDAETRYQIKNIFITDKHLPNYTTYHNLSLLNRVTTFNIEHDMTKADVPHPANLLKYEVSANQLPHFDRVSIRTQLMTASITALTSLHEKVWSPEKGRVLDLKELLSRWLVEIGRAHV